MTLPTMTAREIRDRIKTTLNREVIVVGLDGTCLSAYEPDLEGRSIAIPSITAGRGGEIRTMEHGETSYVVTPISHERETVGYLLINDVPQQAKSYLPLLKSFSELLIQQQAAQSEAVLDTTDQFMVKVLRHATESDIPLYESEAEVLGYDVTVPRLAIVLHLKHFWDTVLEPQDQPSYEREDVIKEWKQRIDKQLSTFFTQNSDYIIGYIGADKFAVFQAVEPKDQERIINLAIKSHDSLFTPLCNFYIKDLVVGIGNPYPGITGIINSFREADLALEFGSRLWGDNRTYYFGHLGILSILGEGNREQEVQFADQLLGRLTNASLIKTLECFFDQNLNLTTTAEAMGIHRNTVIYRLSRISEILGVDPRVFDQAMTIKIALLIKKLFG